MGRFSWKGHINIFYQIQGQMFCTLLKRVNFVVYFGKNVTLYVETVTFDEKFWQQILPQIEFFFRRAAVLLKNCSPTEFKEVKICISMVAGRTN